MGKTAIAIIEVPFMNSRLAINNQFSGILVALHDKQPSITLSHDIASFNLPNDAHYTTSNDSTNVLLQSICLQIQCYLQDPNFKFDLTVPSINSLVGTDFQKRVWQAIAQIPAGQTKSYSEIAQQIGSGPRAVANACGTNHLPLFIPCHRVVAKHDVGGFMQGQQHGLAIKKWLLQHEGVTYE